MTLFSAITQPKGSLTCPTLQFNFAILVNLFTRSNTLDCKFDIIVLMNTLNDTIQYDYLPKGLLRCLTLWFNLAVLVYLFSLLNTSDCNFGITVLMNTLNDTIQYDYFALRVINMSKFIVQFCNLSLFIHPLKYIGL